MAAHQTVSELRDEGRGWLQRMSTDGPPLLVVLIVFVVVQTLSMGLGQPLFGAAILAVGVVIGLFMDLNALRHELTEAPAGSVEALWHRPYSAEATRRHGLPANSRQAMLSPRPVRGPAF